MERRWHTAGTNRSLWHDARSRATYTVVPWEKLPPIDASRHDGSFGWLAEEPECNGLCFGLDGGGEGILDDDAIARSVERATATARRERLRVPGAFLALVSGEHLYRRIPTCTACYLELGARPTEIPGEPGRFLRFMNDQQCVLVWGLHLLPDGSHRVVVAKPQFEDEAEGPTLEDVATFVDHAICADDFEEFIHRFWIENALFKASARPEQWTPEMKAYAAHAVARR